MKTIAIPAMERKNVGSKSASQLRREERVPGVVYGGKENLHFSVRELDLRKLTHTTATNIVELEIEGNKQRALLKDIQFHPVTDKPLHVDFVEIVEGKPAEVNLAVKLVGQSEGVRLGGRLTQPMRKLRVLGLAEKLPEELEVDITALKVGDAIRVRDLDLDGIKVLGRSDGVVAAVKMARAVVEEVAVEGEEAAEGEEGAPAAEGEDKPAEGGGEG